MASLPDPAAAMDHQAGYPLGRAPPGHRDVDQRCAPVGQAAEFGRGVVAEHRAGAGPEHGRPQQAAAWQWTAEGRVHTGEYSLPSAGGEVRLHPRLRDPTGERLGPGEHATLLAEQVVEHPPIVRLVADRSHPPTEPVDNPPRRQT